MPTNLTYFWTSIDKDEKVKSIKKVMKKLNDPKYNLLIKYSINYFK